MAPQSTACTLRTTSGECSMTDQKKTQGTALTPHQERWDWQLQYSPSAVSRHHLAPPARRFLSSWQKPNAAVSKFENFLMTSAEAMVLVGKEYKLVPQGRDQVAKLPILVRTETHNFGRSHQSPVRIFTPTVNSALSSSTSIKMLQYFLPCAPHCHSIQRLVE